MVSGNIMVPQNVTFESEIEAIRVPFQTGSCEKLVDWTFFLKLFFGCLIKLFMSKPKFCYGVLTPSFFWWADIPLSSCL